MDSVIVAFAWCSLFGELVSDGTSLEAGKQPPILFLLVLPFQKKTKICYDDGGQRMTA